MVFRSIHAALSMRQILLSSYQNDKRLRHRDSLPTNIHFPEVKLEDHLRQDASGIITILTQPPSTTIPSLEAGDPVYNALVTLATQLNRIDHIPVTQPSHHAVSPRV